VAYGAPHSAIIRSPQNERCRAVIAASNRLRWILAPPLNFDADIHPTAKRTIKSANGMSEGQVPRVPFLNPSPFALRHSPFVVPGLSTQHFAPFSTQHLQLNSGGIRIDGRPPPLFSHHDSSILLAVYRTKSRPSLPSFASVEKLRFASLISVSSCSKHQPLRHPSDPSDPSDPRSSLHLVSEKSKFDDQKCSSVHTVHERSHFFQREGYACGPSTQLSTLNS
jgi:hypothetical protein